MIGTAIAALAAASTSTVRLSEVRIDSLPPFKDVAYVELVGVAGEATDATIVVIGEAWRAGWDHPDSGVVLYAIHVTAPIPADRCMLVSGAPFLMQQPDLTGIVAIGSQQNVTVWLCPGQPVLATGDDIDADDDGQADGAFGVADSLAVVWKAPPPAGDGGPVYSETTIGPAGGLVVWGGSRCIDGAGWSLLCGQYVCQSETPGTLNPPCLAFTCWGDYDSDGQVGTSDLSMVLGAWGASDGPYDLDRDGTVGPGDLALLLIAWGACAT